MTETHQTNPNLESPLHRAAHFGDLDTIRALVAGGADINAVIDISPDRAKWRQPATPLMVAAGSPEGATVDTVRLLLELGANPAITLGHESALTMGLLGFRLTEAQGGDAARARVLIDAGAPLPSTPRERNALLCDTANVGDPERLALLLSHGFSPNGFWDPEAARAFQVKLFEEIKQPRQDQLDELPPMPDNVRASMESFMQRTEQRLTHRFASAPSSFEIPLFRAAESGSADCVRILLQAGADAWIRDNSRRTAMYEANSLAVVRELQSAGLPIEDADEYGWSPLDSSVHDGESALPRIRALIEAGANVNAAHDRGYTVFMSAVGDNRHLDVLRLLIASGANPHAVSDLGYNAFHAAIDVNFGARGEASVRETLSYLKELGVDIEHRNGAGETPLARAINVGTGVEVRVLCELGANPNAVCLKHRCSSDSCAATELPLIFHATESLHRDVKIEALLRAGADPLITDAQNYTPLAHAAAALCRDAANYTEAYKAFYQGLQLLPQFKNPPTTRDEFLALITPPIREYVERFSSTIPVVKTTNYSHLWRQEILKCVISLVAYETWARRQRRMASHP